MKIIKNIMSNFTNSFIINFYIKYFTKIILYNNLTENFSSCDIGYN